MEYCNFLMMDLSKLNWHDIDYFDDIPEKVLFWIRDDQSLTQKLKKRYPDFRVEVHKQDELEIYNHEINQLGNEENFIIREVSLYGDNQPVVFARSVIPKNTKTDSIMKIANIVKDSNLLPKVHSLIDELLKLPEDQQNNFIARWIKKDKSQYGVL